MILPLSKVGVMLQNMCKFIYSIFLVFLTSSICFADNNGPLFKPDMKSKAQRKSESGTEVYTSLNDGSETESRQLVTPRVEIRKNSNIIVTKLNNKKINLTNLNAKWIIVNFWASWCEPCVNEIKEFNQLLKKHKKDLAVFAVNYDVLSIDEQKNLAAKYAIQYPSLLKSSLDNLEIDDISVVPVTYIFNKQGIVKAKLYGSQTVSSIENKLSELGN